MIDRADIDAFLAAPKASVAAMNWREKLSKKDPQWWEFVSALEVGGVVIEDAVFCVQWRSAKVGSQDKYNCALRFQGLRVYAIDFDPDGQHTNKVGIGRPWYRERFGPGAHEHTWSEDGEGYCEPIDPAFPNFQALFEYFCQHAKLNVPGGFVSPPAVQMTLL